MPIYSVQGPDGKTYSIEGPAGATREEVIGAIQARMAQQPRPVTPEPVMAPAPAAPSTQRSFGEAGTDILAAGLGGLGGLLQFPGQVVGLLPGLRPVGEVAQKPGEAVSEFAQSLKSEGLKAREALRSKALSEAEKDGVISQFATAITSTIKDPALITTFVAEQVPLLLGPLGAVKVTQKIGAKTIESAGAGLTGAAAEQAVKEAVKTVNKRAAVAAYGTGAAMQAADVSDDTYRDAYQKALDSGLSEQEAADRAIAAARIAGTGAGVTALLAQRLPGAQAIEKRLAGVPGTKGRVASGFGEAIGESIEEGGGQVFKNIGLRQVDPNQALLEGVGGAAGLGALGGGILGTALGKRTVEQEQRFEGQREGETDRQFAARLQREIDAGLRPPAPPPAAPPAPTLPTDQQLFTLAAQPNGYGLLENLKQRILQDQQFPEADRKAAADNIANLQLKMTEEEATRAQTPKSIVTQAELSQAGILSNDPLASIANRDFVADNQVFDTINQALSGEITDEQRKRYEGLYEGLSQLRQDFYPEGQDAGIPQMVTPPAAPTTPAPQIKSNDELFDMAAKNDYGGLEQYKQGLKAVPQTAEIKQAIADAEFVQRRMNIERAGQFSISSIFEGKDLNNQADVDAVASALYGELKKKGLTPERERQVRTALDVFVNTLPEDVQAPPMPDWAVEIPEKRRVPKAPEARAEEAFRKDLIKKIREVEASSRQLAATSKSLFGALKGRLNPKEVFDISPDRRMAPLKRKSGGVDLDYFVDSGMLDAFLPPHMRHSAAQFDSTESQEYIKDSLRQGVYITFDAKTEIEKNKNTVQDMEKLLKEFDTDEINSQLQEIADEQRAKEPVAEAVPSPAAEGEGRVAEEGIGAPPAEVKGEEKPAAPVKKSLAAIPEARFKELERRVKQAEQRADEAEKAVEQAEEAKPEVPPEIQKKIEILKQVLRKNLNKFGLKDVELNLERGMTDEGSYDGMLIKLALDAADPLGILRHESVHALKEAGFFTDKQWATLEKMADTKWIDQYLKGQRTVYNGQEMSRYEGYMQEYGGNMAMIREEAIADAFRNFSKKQPAGLMGTLTTRMKNFFKAVKSAFNGQGFESAEDIFGKVEEGALKPTKPAEAAAERKSLRGPLGYYSALSQGIEDLKTATAPASGWKDAIKGMVNKGAVKADEVEWSGVNDWLDTQTGKVPKEALADYLNRGGVRINEVVLGAAPSDPELRRIFLEGPSTREEDYRLQDYFAKNPEARFNRPTLVLPGGQNYREVLLTLPLSQEPSGDVEYVSNKTGEVLFTMRAGEDPETIAARERANNATMRLQFKEKKGYQSNHFDQPNILAHVRLDDRIDSDGKKVLFVEEVQSDWAQQGRKRGFGTVTRYEYDVMSGDRRVLTFENKNQAEAYAELRGYDVVEVPFQVDTEIPTGPFVTKTEGWVNLALKRIITIASDEGYDRVAFINGEQSADRYDLSKQVDDLRYGDGTLVALDNGSIVISKKAAPEELPDLVGKEVADRLLKAPEMGANGYRRLTGLDLKVGGEGMKTFYDSIVPTALKKLLPKVGGEKMIGVELPVGGRDTSPVSGEDVMDYLGIPEEDQYQYWNNLGSDGRDRAISDYRNRNLTPAQQPGFDVTPAMREKVKQGQPLFSLRSMPTVDPAIDARVGEVIRPRRKEGFIDRVVEVFSPKTFSLFREELINRYNELAELDKRVAAQIKAAGGPQQLADERAESAALLSDQATAVAAAAMGMHNRKGGIPYYADGVVTVDTSGDNEGIVSIFAPLASTGDLKTFEHYQFWANVNRAKRFILNPGGTRYVEQLLDKDDIKRAEELRQQYLAAGIDFRDIQSRWRKYNDGLVKLMRDTGVISGRASRDFMEHGDYFPFYRQVNEEDVAGPKTFSTIAGTKPPKAAKGSENEFADFFETVVRNTQAAVTMSMKNVAAQKATAQALRINEVVRLSDNPQIKQVSADTWDVFDGDYIDTVPGATKAVAESAARARFGANVNVVESPTNPGQWNVFRPVKIGQVFASSAKDAMEEARTQHLRRPDIYVYKVLENGTPVYYRAYDLKFINAIKAMNMADLPFIGLLAAPANALRTLVTKEPGYMLVNQMRDSLSAYVTSGVKMTPIVDSARQFAASISKETPEMEALFNAGVIGGYEYAHGVKEGAAVFEREVRKKAGVKTTLEQLATPATSLWGALERGTQISDGATRAEVYKRVLAETGNRAEALWQAAEVLNFYRHGRSPIIRVLTAAIPFMNARIQGLDVLYRAGINPMLDKNATDAQRQRMKTFWTRGMTMMALSSMYWMLVHDDEEYKKQEQETRDNYWLIPGMGLKIAIPFEVGVIFKVLPERILQNAFGSDTGKDTLESLKRQLQSTLGFNFIPQAFLPLYETQTNFSFFTQRPIIGQGMEDVAARYQVSPGTSMFAQMLADTLRVETSEDSSEFTKALAKSLDLSPIKVDHVIKGYTGTIGQYAVEVFDAMYNLNADVPKPSKRFEQLPVIKRLALDPDARGQVTGFFDLKNAVDEVVRTSNLLERTAQTEDYTKYLMNNMNVLAQKDYVLALDKSMKEFREMKTMIQYSNMSADVKRDLILDIQRMENQLTTNIQEVRKLAAK